MKSLKVWVRRRWWDFRRGESLYLRLPFSALSYITVIYTLLLERIPFLKMLFPHFYHFALTAFVLYPLFGCVLGWLDRRFHVLSTDMAIAAQNNPLFMELVERVKDIQEELRSLK